ncbi:MAG: hypothetical protein VX113_09900, partial [Pseudomonadota bacterium]|nr:hypothetical protein [Pseudomonadota bacterium]
MSATKCNAESSRSHSIVMVTVTGHNAISGATTHGKLHLVDLAGSERVKKSEVSGQGMAEACNINKSLSALGTVIASLAANEKHVPYRDSKLTYLLQDSLGGNSHTVMLAAISPSPRSYFETLNTMQYAARAKLIICNPKVHKQQQELKQEAEAAAKAGTKKEKKV